MEPPGALEGVSETATLLGFSSRQKEALFVAHFHTSSLSADRRCHGAAAFMKLAIALKPLATHDWFPAGLSTATGVWSLMLMLLARLKPGRYVRLRTLLILVHQILHASTTSLLAPSTLGPPSCPAAWKFWLREANLMLAPWSSLLAVAMPLQFKVAAPAHLLTAALSFSATPWRRQVSTYLCPDSEQHYESAARLASNAAALLSPPQPSSVSAAFEPTSPAAAFWGLHAACHLALCCLVLAWLHSSDGHRRQQWVQQLWPPGTAPSSSSRRKAGEYDAASADARATPFMQQAALGAAWVLCPLFWLCSVLWLWPALPRMDA